MTLHPQAQAVLDSLAAMKLPPPDQVPVAQAREQFMRARASFLAAPEDVAACADRTLPGPAGEIRVRVYRPHGAGPAELLPALVFFHGGGWVFGNLARCAVVAVDYRLAPEDKFPAAVEDALAAVRGVARLGRELGIDGTRLA